MNRFVLLATILILCSCRSEKKKELLFIGNSLTYYNEMPSMLRQMFEEANVDINISQATFPGYSLKAHLNSIVMQAGSSDMTYTRSKKNGELTSTEKMLKNGKYDLVVLQERSGVMLIPELVNSETQKSVSNLEILIGNKSEIFLYQNYPLNESYPKVVCREVNEANYCTDTLYSATEELSLLSECYDIIDEGKRVVPIGEIFKHIMVNEKEISLFSDSVHPSLEGSFVIALKFYKEFSGKNCVDLVYKNELSAEVSDKLKQIVDLL